MAKYYRISICEIGGDHGQGSMKLEFQLANVIEQKKLWYFPLMKATTPGTKSTKQCFNIMLIH